MQTQNNMNESVKWVRKHITHPRRPRGSQSGREKRRNESFQVRTESPWVPTLTEQFPEIQADVGSWLGTKNALYYCAQSANSFSWVIFVCSYTTAIVSPHLPGSFTKLVRARETFTFYFPNLPETKELPMSRKSVWDAISRSNWIWPEYSVFHGSQCIVNNRKFYDSAEATRKSTKQ